jgi:hypothetical protein
VSETQTSVPETPPTGTAPIGPASRRILTGVAVAIVAVVGLVAWLVLRGNGDSVGSTSSRTSAVAVTRNDLRRLAATLRHPVFWLGPKAGYTYELTQTPNGRVYVRYLPHGVALGAPTPYLTVATYPFTGAFTAVSKQAAATGVASARLAHGGLAVLDRAYPRSVHLAFPGLNYQVEVYDPTPGRALELLAAGKLTSVGNAAAGQSGSAPAKAAAPAGVGSQPAGATLPLLESFAARLGHPIYWAGPKPGYTYELTQTADGKVFVRYLPSGVKIGDPRPDFLTVATYPFPGAFATVRRTSGGAVVLELAHGGIAVVDTRDPKSIHLAYPGVGYQVEVFDPLPAAGRALVAAGRIMQVP